MTRTGRVSATANVSGANVKPANAGARRQNEARTRQAVRGIKEMFKKDGLL